MNERPSAGAIPQVLLLVAALGIAAAFPLGAAAMVEGSPTAVSSARYLSAMLVIGGTMLAMHRRPWVRALPRPAVIAVVAMGVSTAFFNLVFLEALRWLDPSHGALLIAGSMPITASLLARVWLGERIRTRQVVGIAVATLGTAIVLTTTAGATGPGRALVGSALFLLGGVIWGANSVISQVALRYIDTMAATVWSIAFGLLVLVPLAVASAGPSFILALGPTVWLAALLGLVSTAIPLLCLLAAIRSIGAARASAASFLVPIFALVLDLLFLNQFPTAIEAGGGAMVVAGFILITR